MNASYEVQQRPVWVLGATGRIGAHVATVLSGRGYDLVLTGRNAVSLKQVVQGLEGPARTVVGGIDEILRVLPAAQAPIVLNTIGPFHRTAPLILAACPAGSAYVDLANDLPSFLAVRKMEGHLVENRCTCVSGAGFGVTASEALLRHLCDGRESPTRVRVDTVPSVAMVRGTLGAALAETIVAGVAFGPHIMVNGRLSRADLGADALTLITPDGDTVVTACVPTGELLSAWDATAASEIAVANSFAPSTRVARTMAKLLSLLVRNATLAGAIGRMLSRMKTSNKPAPRAHSWVRAEITWPGGRVEQAWLQTGDAMVFTASVMATVAERLSKARFAPGAHTPAALLGADVALLSGATIFRD